MIKRILRVRYIIYSFICCGFIIYLFRYSAEINKTILNSLILCINTLVPSIFPFMIISGIIGKTYIGYMISYPLRIICKYIYGMPSELAPVMLNSFIGGYPAGITSIIELKKLGIIDSNCCDECSKFFIYSSPAFVITVVGIDIFKSQKIGVIIYLLHILGGLCLRWILCPRIIKVKNLPINEYESIGSALVSSTLNAVQVTLNMCGFVVIANILLNFLEISGFVNLLIELFYKLTFGIIKNVYVCAFLNGFIEICSSISLINKLSYIEAIFIVPFIVSFGGMCVILQLKSICKMADIKTNGFVFARFLHGIITTVIELPILYVYFDTKYTFVSQNTPLFTENNNIILILSMLGIFIVLISAIFALYGNVKEIYMRKTIKNILKRT